MAQHKKISQNRRAFLKSSIAATSGLAALPLISQIQPRTISPDTKITALPHMRTAILSPTVKNFTVADLNTLQMIAIGSLTGAQAKYVTEYQKVKGSSNFKGATSKELADLAQAGHSGWAPDTSSGCGSCASCCCCCCPCCCCT